MKPSILVFTLDCLRAANSSESNLPFVNSFPLQWSRCFSSGTWTLPAHASLFAGCAPLYHRVTRPGDKLPEESSQLPKVAQNSGYQTAIFSENPTFSQQTGFGHAIDHAHDDIHQKILPSDFSPYGEADRIDASTILSLSFKILSRSNRVRDFSNAMYAAYSHFISLSDDYPHHGDRVINHLESYLSKHQSPLLAVTNILEPHNPYLDTPPGIEEQRNPRELEALRAGGDNKVYLLTDQGPPKVVEEVYGGWQQLFDAQTNVYDEYANESDRLLRELKQAQPSIFANALVVVIGDHGQLFGAENMVGHHTSLHPHGIQVPLAIDPPKQWDRTERKIQTPVSLAGLSQAMIDVTKGDIRESDSLESAIEDYSKEIDGRVITCVDGPTWDISKLKGNEKLDNKLVEELAIRKVGCVQEDCVVVFESKWESDDVNSTPYEYKVNERKEISTNCTPIIPDEVESWLLESYDYSSEERDSVGSQLEALGYL